MCVRLVMADTHGGVRTMIKAWMDKGLRSHSLQAAISNYSIKEGNCCMNQACVNDGFRIQERMANVLRDDEKYGESPNFKFYQLALGRVVASTQELPAGKNFTHMVTK